MAPLPENVAGDGELFEALDTELFPLPPPDESAGVVGVEEPLALEACVSGICVPAVQLVGALEPTLIMGEDPWQQMK